MNHVKFRKRTPQDNTNSVLNIKIQAVKSENIITVPEPLIDPIIYWAKYKINNKKITVPEEKDKLLKECLKWPSSTKILCYNCCHSFKGVPVPIPTIHDKKRNIYFCHGNFCSWQCSKAYNINEMPKSGQGNRNMNISLLARRMWTNYQVETGNKDKKVYSITITAASRRSELKVFGGTKTIEEYREGFFGIIPPEEALECKPFISIKNRLCLPFVDRNYSTEAIESTSSSQLDNSSFSFTRKIESSAVHQHANNFCERLNKAKNEKVLIKRERKNESNNTLMSSMGVVVKRKK